MIVEISGCAGIEQSSERVVVISSCLSFYGLSVGVGFQPWPRPQVSETVLVRRGPVFLSSSSPLLHPSLPLLSPFLPMD